MSREPNPESRRIFITGVPQKSKRELVNISKNTGIDVSALMKPKVFELINSYPPDMREKKE